MTTPSVPTKPYLLSLRNPGGMLMHAGIRQATDPQAALEEYLDDMPPPFNSYDILSGSSTHNADHYQFTLGMGPFQVTATAELLTAAPATPAGSRAKPKA